MLDPKFREWSRTHVKGKREMSRLTICGIQEKQRPGVIIL
jgi:hypothetical protein